MDFDKIEHILNLQKQACEQALSGLYRIRKTLEGNVKTYHGQLSSTPPPIIGEIDAGELKMIEDWQLNIEHKIKKYESRIAALTPQIEGKEMDMKSIMGRQQVLDKRRQKLLILARRKRNNADNDRQLSLRTQMKN